MNYNAEGAIFILPSPMVSIFYDIYYCDSLGFYLFFIYYFIYCILPRVAFVEMGGYINSLQSYIDEQRYTHNCLLGITFSITHNILDQLQLPSAFKEQELKVFNTRVKNGI